MQQEKDQAVEDLQVKIFISKKLSNESQNMMIIHYFIVRRM